VKILYCEKEAAQKVNKYVIPGKAISLFELGRYFIFLPQTIKAFWAASYM
jgi:hypothetical protein